MSIDKEHESKLRTMAFPRFRYVLGLVALTIFMFPLASHAASFQYPLNPYQTCSYNFGDPRESTYHAGQDCIGSGGTRVYAVSDGTVSYSAQSVDYGWLMAINHPGDEVYSLYGHLSTKRWKITPGSSVQRGILIGYLADADEDGAVSSEPHLHYGIRTGQREDYPATGDNAWTRGYTTAYPTSLGWQNPTVYIDSHPGWRTADDEVRWHPDGTLIKTATNDAVYMVVNGTKRVFLNSDTFRAYRYDRADIIIVPDVEILECLPSGAPMPVPSIAKSSTESAVYMLTGDGTKRQFLSPTVFTGLGFSWSQVQVLSQATIDSYRTLAPITTIVRDGELISKSDGRKFVVCNGQLWHISAPSVFEALGYRWEDVATDDSAFAAYPESLEITWDTIRRCVGLQPDPELQLQGPSQGQNVPPGFNYRLVMQVNDQVAYYDLHYSRDDFATDSSLLYSGSVGKKSLPDVNNGIVAVECSGPQKDGTQTINLDWSVPDLNSNYCAVRAVAYDDYGKVVGDMTPTFVVSSSLCLPPTGVNASDGAYNDRIHVTWNASNGATSYQIWRGASGNTSTAVWIDSVSDTCYEDYGVAGNVTYYYWIKATNGTLTSDFSSYDTGFRRQQPPNLPSNPSPVNGATGISRTGVSLSWTGGGSSGSVQYRLFFHSAPDVENGWDSGWISATSWAIPIDLAGGMAYYWLVRARGSDGQEVNGPVWQFTTAYAYFDYVPQAPTVTGTVAPNSPVTLSVMVENQGAFVSTGAYVRFYLSRTAGAREIELTPGVPESISGLQPGQSRTINFATTLDNLQAGQSYIDAWVDTWDAGAYGEHNVANNTSSAAINYVDGVSPIVSYLGLHPGLTYYRTGMRYDILVTADDDVGIRSFDFYWSTDNGATWNPIAQGWAPDRYGSTQQYAWTIPGGFPLTDNLRLRAVAWDTSNNAGELTAGPYVVRDGTAPEVTVVSPNGGEIWDMGSHQEIKWSISSVNAIRYLEIYFHFGNVYDRVDVLSDPTTNSYQWTLRNNFSTSTGRVRIRVTDVNGNVGEDYSDGFFAVNDTSLPPPAPWGMPEAISTVPPQTIPGIGRSADFTDPRVAVDADGNVHLVYLYNESVLEESIPGEYINHYVQSVYYQKRVGTVWTAPETLLSLDSRSSRRFSVAGLQVAVDALRRPHVLWRGTWAGSQQWNQDDIFYTYRDGTTWTEPLNLTNSIRGGYEVKTLSWTGGPSLPSSISSPATAVANGKLYVFGVEFSTRVYEYDPSTNAWTRKGDMPNSGIWWGDRATAIGNTIYAVSGSFEYNMRIYNPVADTWTSGAAIPTPRMDMSLESVNGKVYAIGGRYSTALATNEVYDPATDTWATAAPMPMARSSAASAVYDNKIYVIGGDTGGSYTNYIQIYDPAANTWENRGWGSGCIIFPTNAGAVAKTYDSKIYVFGKGFDDCVDEYDPVTNLWKPMPSLLARRGFAGGGIIGSKMYLVGGTDETYQDLSTLEIGTFTSEQVGTVSSSPNIEAAPDGRLHMVWQDGGYWQPDPAACMRISYVGPHHIYHLVKDAEGVWSVPEQLTSDWVSSPAFAIDAAGRLHLAMSSFPDIDYMCSGGSTWSLPVLAVLGNENGANTIKVKAGHSGVLHMGWITYDNALQRNRVLYSAYDGSSWSPAETATVVYGQFVFALGVDSMNRPHYVWTTGDYPPKLFYSMKSGDQWSPPIQLHCDSQPVSQTSCDAAISPVDDVMHVVWVSWHDGYQQILYNHADVGFTTDIFPPSVAVVAPSSSEALSIGTQYEIRWNATDGTGVTGVDVAYTIDGGVSWVPVASGEPNDGSFVWTVANVEVAAAQIRVTAHDAAGNAGVAVSGTFSITDVTPPSITLDSPVGGAALLGKSAQEIRWTAVDNAAVTSVDLDYSLDNGSTWSAIATGLTNVPPYAWSVPNIATSGLLIRATAYDAQGHYASAMTAPVLSIARANTLPIAPHSPLPLSGTVATATSGLQLSWASGDPDGDLLTYQVHFGTELNPPMVSSGPTDIYAPATLAWIPTEGV